MLLEKLHFNASIICGCYFSDVYLRTQIAGQDNKSGEGADFMDDGTFTLLKVPVLLFLPPFFFSS